MAAVSIKKVSMKVGILIVTLMALRDINTDKVSLHFKPSSNLMDRYGIDNDI